jgi:hypothetical protein
MCGFSGELRFDGQHADTRAVAVMTATMEARGPDATGLWSQGPAAFGHQHLSIWMPKPCWKTRPLGQLCYRWPPSGTTPPTLTGRFDDACKFNCAIALNMRSSRARTVAGCEPFGTV